jgi:hypothetical protein
LENETAELVETRKPFSYPSKLHHLPPAQGTIGAVAIAQPRVRLGCFSFLSDAFC